MILLPKNVQPLAKLASQENGRYALQGLRVKEYAGDRYEIQVTDGKAIAFVRGECVAADDLKADAHKVVDRLKAGPNSAYDYLVPVDQWDRAFKLVPRAGCLGLVASPQVVTLATPDATLTTPQCDGRFPDTDYLVKSRHDKPVVTVKVTPKLLAKLLTIAAEFTQDGTGSVELGITDENTSIVLMTRNGSGQTFDALIMPCS